MVWYTSHSDDEEDIRSFIVSDDIQVNSLLTFDEIRQLTTLAEQDPKHLANVFADCTTAEGLIPATAFVHTMRHYMRAKDGESRDRLRLDAIARHLYAAFDTDDDGNVDYPELVAGLATLCGGNAESSVSMPFALFAAEPSSGTGEPRLAFSDLQVYLDSVFRLRLRIEPALARTVSTSVQQATEEMTAELMAAAERIVQESEDAEADSLTWKQYLRWVKETTGDLLAQGHRAEQNGEAQQSNGGGTRDVATMQLDEIARTTGLARWNVQDMFDVFEDNASEDGSLSKDDFANALDVIAANSEDMPTGEEFQAIIDRLFALFDTDGTYA